MKDGVVKNHIAKLVGKMVCVEIKSDSADFIIKRDGPQHLKTFKWQTFSSEICTLILHQF